jgi:hypothetical protein
MDETGPQKKAKREKREKEGEAAVRSRGAARQMRETGP